MSNIQKKNIERYRIEYPDDNCISDDELVRTLNYAQFQFNSAVEDFTKSMASALVSEMYKIKNIFHK